MGKDTPRAHPQPPAEPWSQVRAGQTLPRAVFGKHLAFLTSHGSSHLQISAKARPGEANPGLPLALGIGAPWHSPPGTDPQNLPGAAAQPIAAPAARSTVGIQGWEMSNKHDILIQHGGAGHGWLPHFWHTHACTERGEQENVL